MHQILLFTYRYTPQNTILVNCKGMLAHDVQLLLRCRQYSCFVVTQEASFKDQECSDTCEISHAVLPDIGLLSLYMA